MKFSREIEYKVLGLIKKRLAEQKIEHPEETFRISEVKQDSYGEEPCLFVSMTGENTRNGEAKIDFVVRVGVLES